MEPGWLDIDEAARILGLHRTGVRRYIVLGLLKAEKRRSPRCARPMWHTTGEWIAQFRSERAARKRIEMKAARFGAGMTAKPCATSASTTGSTEESSSSTTPDASSRGT
jgi:hypothetical protein